MKYVIVTVEWAASRGIMLTPEMRKSLDGSKVVLHEEIAGLISKNSDSIVMGDPWTVFNFDKNNVYGFSRTPLSPVNNLYIGKNKSNEWGNAALYQLRLIKTQPTDIQLEVIKHQVLMEHNDYVKEMGWE